MGIIKGILGIGAVFAIGSMIAAKSHVKSPNKMLDTAKRRHGACTALATEERDGKVFVTVRDLTQGFTYTICSAMRSMDCDGSTLFHYENTTDDFDRRLFEFTLDAIRPQLEAVLTAFGAACDMQYREEMLMQIVMPDADAARAPELALRIAGIWQQCNVNQRLDRKTIWVDAPERVHMGSVKLPDLQFLDNEAETVQWVMRHFQNLAADSAIRYLRTEEHTLGEIGCPFARVTRTYGTKFPQKPEDKVKCYYFDINGTEYFAADFFDNTTGNLFMNYPDGKPKRTAN